MDQQTAYNWQIKDHSRQLGLLERALKNNRLAHAYVFSGPSQIGKRLLAKRLAQILLCEAGTACDSCMQCRTFSVGSNADYMEINGDDTIKIEQVRDLGYKLSLKPYSGKHKIAIIDGAHNLTVEAANALLKVLEEPKPHTLMILVTDNSSRLLPTISSRAQKIQFAPLDREMVAEEEFQFTYKEFMNSSLGQKLAMAAELSEKETVELKNILNYWLHRLQKMLRENPESTLIKKIKAVLRAQRLLDQNVNTKLLLSELMVNAN